MNFMRLIGENVTLVTYDNMAMSGVIDGLDEDGWIFMARDDDTYIAIDSLAVTSVTVPAGYYNKSIVVTK